MSQALAQLQVVGPATNVDFLRRLMVDTAFAEADLDTGLIERQRETLLPTPRPATIADLTLAAKAVLQNEPQGCDPWDARSGWRLGPPLQRRLQFRDSGASRDVLLTYRDGGCWATVPDATAADAGTEAVAITIVHPLDPHRQADPARQRGGRRAVIQGARHVSVEVGQARAQATVVFDDATVHLFTPDRHLRLEFLDALAQSADTADEGGRLTAPMPGKVISILVEAGATVRKGEPLLVMEAMKMEHTITAPADGKVALIHYGVGDQVAEGEALVAIEASGPT